MSSPPPPLPHSRAWMESHWDGMLDEVLREPRPRSAPISTTILLAELSVLRVHTGPLIDVLASVGGIAIEDDIRSLVQRGLATPSQLWSLLERFGDRFFLPMRQRHDPGWSADEFRDAMVQLASKRDGVFSPQRFVVVATIVLGCMRRAFVSGGQSDAATALHALLDSVITILANAVGTSGSQEDVAEMMRAAGMDQYQRQFNAAAAAASAYPSGESSSSAAAAAAAAAAAYASSAPPAPPVSSMDDDDDAGGAGMYPGEQLSQFDSLDSQQEEQQQPMPSSQSEWPLLPPLDLPPSPGASAEEHQAYDERMEQYAATHPPPPSAHELLAGLGFLQSPYTPSLPPSRSPSDMTQEQQRLMHQVAALQSVPPPAPPVYAAAAPAASAAAPGSLGPDSNPPRIYSHATATPEQKAMAEARRPPTRVSNDFKSVAELERDIRYYEGDLIPSLLTQIDIYRARGDTANRVVVYEGAVRDARADADRAREALQIARHASRAPSKARSNKKKTKKAEEEEEARRQAEVRARDAEWSANVERLQMQLTKAQAQQSADGSADVTRLHMQLRQAQVDHDARVGALTADLERARQQHASAASETKILHETAMSEAVDRAEHERSEQAAQIAQLQKRVESAAAQAAAELAAVKGEGRRALADAATAQRAELAVVADERRGALADATAQAEAELVAVREEARRALASATAQAETDGRRAKRLHAELAAAREEEGRRALDARAELERAHAAQLAELRTTHETDLDARRSTLTQRVAALTEAVAQSDAAHAKQLAVLAGEHQAALAAKDAQHKREIEEVHARQSAAIENIDESLRADFEKRAAAAKAEFDAQVAATKVKYKARAAVHYKEMEQLSIDHEQAKADLAALRVKQAKTIDVTQQLVAMADAQKKAVEDRLAHEMAVSVHRQRAADDEKQQLIKAHDARVADISAKHRVDMDRLRREVAAARQAPVPSAAAAAAAAPHPTMQQLAEMTARATKFQRLRLAQLLDTVSDADLDLAIAEHGKAGRADAALASLVDAAEAEREQLLIEAWKAQRVSRTVRSILGSRLLANDLFDTVPIKKLQAQIKNRHETNEKDMQRVVVKREGREDGPPPSFVDLRSIHARLAAIEPAAHPLPLKTHADLREVLQKLHATAGAHRADDKAALDALEKDDVASGLYEPLEAHVNEANDAARGKSFAELVRETETEARAAAAAGTSSSNKKKGAASAASAAPAAAAAAAAAAAPPRPKLTDEERAQRERDAMDRKNARERERRRVNAEAARAAAAAARAAKEEAARATEEEKAARAQIEYEYEYGASSSASAAAAAYHPPPLPPLAFQQHPFANAAAAAAAAARDGDDETDDDEPPVWEQQPYAPRGAGMGAAHENGEEEEEGPAHKKPRMGRRFHLLPGGTAARAKPNCFNCDKAAPALMCACTRVHFCNRVCLERASGMHKCM